MNYVAKLGRTFQSPYGNHIVDQKCELRSDKTRWLIIITKLSHTRALLYVSIEAEICISNREIIFLVQVKVMPTNDVM